jgi:hypothetical protein
MVKDGKTLCAECMSAMNEDPRYLFTDIELFSAVIAEVEASCLVISFREILVAFGLLVILLLFNLLTSFLL